MEKIKEIEELTKPIIKYIKENYNPHTTIIISQDYTKVVVDEINIPMIYN